MKTCLVACYCALATFASVCRAETVPLKDGASFVQARSRLQAAGWRADPAAHAVLGEYAGMDRRLIERGFDEVDYCSGGETFCVLQYVRGKSCLRVQTQGEQLAAMKIVAWSTQCRERTPGEPLTLLPAEVRFIVQRRADCDTFGDCDGVASTVRKLKKKYARNPDAMKALQLDSQNADAVRK